MLRQFKRLNNESGIVLFFVLMVSIIIMIFSLGVMTQSMNEINYAQQQIDQITSDQLAKGIFWNAYSSPGFAVPAGAYQNEDGGEDGVGRNYQINMVLNSTVNGISSYNVVVNYDFAS